ncbi:hypothetical protein [Curtobacterium sp. MCBD17_003]|uniref:hypothetical protein n=1 Tax=Curtobacterium sp. MCBD17_003 TaxID=2175667 RepID=UPI0011B6F0B3|nr:hypothetical protein [Curtobacterium sp. MCBD17_003]WIE56070.1 hypothetical protein DEI88_007735 [Curtobacterium sp. MCBD17_003]
MSVGRPVVAVAAALAMVAVLLLSACSASRPSDPVRAARALPDAPAWVAKPTGTDCGSARLEVGDLALPERSLRCLTDAHDAGGSATVSWVELTTEGDPVPTFVRMTSSGVSVASTSAFDAYGQGGWTTWQCADLQEFLRSRTCAAPTDAGR